LIVVHLAVRLAFLAIKPVPAVSVDVSAWYQVATELRQGRNPYVTTEILVHPPFGLQVAWAVDRIANLTGWQFPTAYFLFLVPFELSLVVLCYVILRDWQSPKAAKWIVLGGVTAQPALLFQACQHGNIDLFVGLFCVLGCAGFMAFLRSNDRWQYASACVWIGLGILVKIVPVMLAPLAFTAWRRSWRLALGGGVLLCAPLVAGLLGLAATSPWFTLERIAQYRSYSGYFGISGLLQQWQLAVDCGIEAGLRKAFPILAIEAVLFALWITWRQSNHAGGDHRWVYLLALSLILFVVTLGPGYAPQYVYWWWPLLVIASTLFGRAFMIWSVLLWLVAAVTFTVEYGFFRSHGELFSWFSQPQIRPAPWVEQLESPWGQSWLRAPLFLIQAAVLATGVIVLIRASRTDALARNQQTKTA